jgi:hypothetical protein
MTEAQELKLDKIYDEMKDLITVLKGYNGYPGLLKEFATLKSDFWSYIDNRASTCPVGEQIKLVIEEVKGDKVAVEKKIDEMKKELIVHENKPRKEAWKWFQRVLLIIISSAAVAFFTLWVETIREQAKSNSSSPPAVTQPLNP